MQLLEDEEQGRQTFDKIYSFGMDSYQAWDNLYDKTADGKFRLKSRTNLVDSIYGKDGDAKILATEATNENEKQKRNRQQKKRNRRLYKMGLLNLFEKVRLV